MSAASVFTLQMLGLAGLVLLLFGLRRRIGLTPLYVTLGVFQPIQVLLSASVYVELYPGLAASPGSLMFSAGLFAMLLVYIREDTLEVRRLVYGILGANLVMTGIMVAVAWQLQRPGITNFLGLSSDMFVQGARVTFVGTAVLVADVVIMVLLYGVATRGLGRHPLLRATLTLTGVLWFDAIAFTTGSFVEHPDYGSILLAGLFNKTFFAVGFSVCLMLYLRYVEPRAGAAETADHPLRDVFYSLSYRDKFEIQAARTRALAEERRQMFERITDAFVAMDRDWKYTFVNRMAAEILGKSADDLVGKSIWDALPADLGGQFDLAYRQAMSEQTPVAFEAFHAPGQRWFEFRIYPSPDGLTMYFHDITERVLRNIQAVEQAKRDDLTGLPNRLAIREAIDARLAQAHAPDTYVGLVALNIDRLHQVNDTLGYAAGDVILMEVARRLRAFAAARGCEVARIGGDEFLLATGWLDTFSVLEVLTRDATAVVARPYDIAGQSIYLTCSAGVAWYPEAGKDAATLLGEADLAVNVAKQRGRNQTVLHSAQRSAALASRLEMTTRMREGLQSDEFSLVLQPLVDAASGRIVAAEALLRWHSAKLGQVAPAAFVSVAEDAGMIVDLGDWVLKEALARIASWTAAGRSAVPISVNVSVAQLGRGEFVREVELALERSGVMPELLKLEITESLFLEDVEGAIALLHRMRRLGVRISLDDFGTGYSNLGNLRRLPIDEIKIDRSFVRDLPNDAYASTLCQVIIGMSRQLGVTVVAEGVETAAQAEFLRGAGCHVLQGYLFGRPVSPAVLQELLPVART